MKFHKIVEFLRKEFPGQEFESIPPNDLFDGEISLKDSPFHITVYNGLCSVNERVDENGGIYFRHHVFEVAPKKAAMVLKKYLHKS